MARRVAVLTPGDHLGDGLMRLPLLHGIRKRWPEHDVWWLAGGPTSMTTGIAPYARGLIERVQVGFNIERPILQVVREARDLPPFDVAFCIYVRMLNVFVVKAALRPREFYACLAFQLGSTGRDPSWTIHRPKHMKARIRSMAAAARCELPAIRDVLPVSDAARAAARRMLDRDRRSIAFITSTANLMSPKAWPLDRFIALARRLIERGDSPVFLIGPEEVGFIPRIRSEVPHAVVAELHRPDPETGAQGVDMCLALGERLTAAVATDTGLAHVLAVTGTPLVSLFGPTDPARWAPETECLRVIRAQDFGSKSMDAIPFGPVAEALDRLLAVVSERRMITASP